MVSTDADPVELQETMNFWKQMTHVMSYFKEENFRGDERLPSSFMQGFLEVRTSLPPARPLPGTYATLTNPFQGRN